MSQTMAKISVKKAPVPSFISPKINLTVKRDLLKIGEMEYIDSVSLEFTLKFSPCANFTQAQQEAPKKVSKEIALGLVFCKTNRIKNSLSSSVVPQDTLLKSPPPARSTLEEAQKWGKKRGYEFGYKYGDDLWQVESLETTATDYLDRRMTYVVFPNELKLWSTNGNYCAVKLINFNRDIQEATFTMKAPVTFTDNAVLQEFCQALFYGFTLAYWYDSWVEPVDGVQISLSASQKAKAKAGETAKTQRESWV